MDNLSGKDVIPYAAPSRPGTRPLVSTNWRLLAFAAILGVAVAVMGLPLYGFGVLVLCVGWLLGALSHGGAQ